MLAVAYLCGAGGMAVAQYDGEPVDDPAESEPTGLPPR